VDKCPDCNHKNFPGLSFCEACGSALDADAEPTPVPRMNTIIEFLGSIELLEHLPAFEENHISYDDLAELSNDELKEIGVESLGHRKKLLEAVKCHSISSHTAIPVPPPPLAMGSKSVSSTSEYLDEQTALRTSQAKGCLPLTIIFWLFVIGGIWTCDGFGDKRQATQSSYSSGVADQEPENKNGQIDGYSDCIERLPTQFPYAGYSLPNISITKMARLMNQGNRFCCKKVGGTVRGTSCFKEW
jgi:hypothetical protein